MLQVDHGQEVDGVAWDMLLLLLRLLAASQR